MNIFIVIPAFNEQKRIGTVLQKLQEYKIPIIMVDDGSKDKTVSEARKFPITVLQHKLNLGKGAALKTGSDAAFLLGADAVIMMDSDGQHKPDDLTKFVDALNNGFEIIYGSRNMSLGVPFVRFVGNKIASVIVSLFFGLYVSDLLCGYRAFTKKAYEKIRWESSGYGVETEMVVKHSKFRLKYCEVPVETIYFEKFKGVTIMDAFGIFYQIVCWRLGI